MVFNSITFLVFFVLFFNLYWLISHVSTINVRNAFTLAASYFFYGWWDWRFLTLIVASSAVDYFVGLRLGKTNKPLSRKLLLYLSIAVNLSILGFFKYYNFFIGSLNDILSSFAVSINTATLKIILPVGISFYTFQTLSYSIDVYKRKLKPARNPVTFFAFVAFFPQLVAGPIERAGHLLVQFREKKAFGYELAASGLRLVLWGFFKKVVLADNFGVLTDAIFQSTGQISGFSTLAGAFFFGIQIYADFSGYSDMAIGIGRMLGFNLMKNFNTPYFAASFREFWQRWHISLSTWFRDYVYIPLGGNRVGWIRLSLNLIVTFLLSGLWHGAEITFLLWGGLHGLAYFTERLLPFRRSRKLAAPFIFIIVTLFWIPFRADNFDHFIRLSESLIHFRNWSPTLLSDTISDFSFIRFAVLTGILILSLVVESRFMSLDFSEWISRFRQPARWTGYFMLIITILAMGNFDVKPYFIYFQF